MQNTLTRLLSCCTLGSELTSHLMFMPYSASSVWHGQSNSLVVEGPYVRTISSQHGAQPASNKSSTWGVLVSMSSITTPDTPCTSIRSIAHITFKDSAPQDGTSIRVGVQESASNVNANISTSGWVMGVSGFDTATYDCSQSCVSECGMRSTSSSAPTPLPTALPHIAVPPPSLAQPPVASDVDSGTSAPLLVCIFAGIILLCCVSMFLRRYRSEMGMRDTRASPREVPADVLPPYARRIQIHAMNDENKRVRVHAMQQRPIDSIPSAATRPQNMPRSMMLPRSVKK